MAMDLPGQGNALQGAMGAGQPGAGAPAGAGPAGAPSANPLMGGAPQGGQQQTAAPSHEMAASTLHHLAEMRRHFVDILKNPSLGKADLKGQMLDTLADLMSEGILDAPKSVSMIQMFPANPPEQKQWIEQSLGMLEQAQAKILEDHRMSHPGTGVYAAEVERHHRRGSHGDALAGVIDHYQPKRSRRG